MTDEGWSGVAGAGPAPTLLMRRPRQRRVSSRNSNASPRKTIRCKRLITNGLMKKGIGDARRCHAVAVQCRTTVLKGLCGRAPA